MPRRILILLVITVLWCAMPSYAAPTISNVVCPSSSAMYDKLEISFDVGTVATNYFWPYDTNTPASITPGVGVTVEGLFSKDNWATTITVPAFYYQEYSRRLVTGTGTSYNDEANTPVGQPHWLLRFAPTQTGTWRYKIRVTDSSGTTTYPLSGDNSFTCTYSNNHGFVRVSPTDSRYFETSDGKTLLAPGVNAHFRSTYEADSLLQTYGSNGVKTARWWMTYREWQSPFAGGASPVSGGPHWQFGLTLSTQGGRKSGDRYAAQLATTKMTHQRVYLTAGVLYRFTGYIKTDAVVASSGQGVIAFLNTTQSTAMTGTNDWTAFTVNYTPSSSGTYTVGVKNTGSSGIGYFDDISLKSSTDGGSTWSGEYLSKPDLDTQNYVDMKEAWKVDRIFDAAKQNGVYLKTVITEKSDSVLGCISSEGNTVAQSDNNFYASANHPSRWLQKAWWRYITARWGAYTSVHSWELCNEGDPFNGNHWDAASALADYMHTNDPNSHLSTTSFWHSIPMEYWKVSSCDYMDFHEYIGPQNITSASHGPRFYAWYDGNTSDTNSILLPMDVTYGHWSIDNTTAHSGSRSTKLVAYAGNTGGGTFEAGTIRQYHVGINPSHTYTCRYWAKGDNIGNPGGSASWVRPGVKISWSKAYHENDWISDTRTDATLGTYDWTQFTKTGITPPATANTANIQITCTRRPEGEVGDGTIWVDDIEFIDETTGESLFVDGGIEADRIDYDSALAIQKYGVLATSYGKRVSKPMTWGETGIRGDNIYGSPYKGYYYSEENQQLVDDTGGVYIKKMIWGHVNYGNPNMFIWWTDNIAGKNLWPFFMAFQNFIADVPLSNGRFVDAKTTSTDPNLRAWGQKDLTGNTAILWVDNSKHTWKNVVDGVSIPAVSGTITLTGLRDGAYKVEWWNTSTGAVTGTENVTCTGGSINLTISNLATDKACKIFQNDSSPPTGSISINGGATTTTSTLVTLSLSATDADSGVSMMRFSNDNSVWTDWEVYNTSKTWNTTDGDGTKTVYVQYMNGGQIQSPCYNDTILSDATQPSGSIIINSGAASTGTTAVTLTLSATDATSGVAQMRFSDDGSTWTSWETYSTNKSWTLPSGDGSKTVYAQFSDAAGNLSSYCSDSITLATAMPDGSVSINSGAEYVGSTSVTLTVSDGGGGATQMRFSNDGSSWSTWQTYATSKSWTLTSGDGLKTVYTQFKNSFGTTSSPSTDTITLDTTAPAGTISVNAGAQYTNSTSVTVNMTISDTGSGMSQMRFSNDNSSWSTWESFSTSKSWTLTSGSGSKTVYAQFKDTLNNTSSSITDTITLDTVAPSGTVTINSGASYTTSTAATLTLSATDATSGVAQMRFSNDNSSWSTWETYATSKAWTLASGDGLKTVYVQYRDNAGTASVSITDTITYDTAPPTGSIVINGGAESINTTSVTLTLSATDTGSSVARMRFSNDNSSWSIWETYAASKAWTLASGDGTKTVYAQFEDGAGNVSASYSDTIELVVTMPDGSVSVNAGAVYTNTTSVTLTLSDGGGGAVQVRFSNDGSSWSAWQTYASSKSWTLASGDGVKTVYAQYKNNVGTLSSPCCDSITLDSTNPSGSISVNTGAQYTNSANVTVTVSVTDTGSGMSQMRFSNDGSTWGSWETYATSKAWTLTSGNGTRTVYAQFRDVIGNTTSSLSDAITLDTVAPTGTISINSGATYATSTSVALTLSGSDATSTVAQMRFSNDGSTWTSWETYATSKSWTLTSGDGTKTVYVQYRDGAGNTSTNYTDTIILTNSGPTGTIIINAGADYVNQTNVILALSANGGLTAITQMRFSNDGTTWSSWQTYGTSKTWALASGDGVKTVYVQYRDEVGRTSPSYSDTIILDTAIPTISIASPTNRTDYYSNHLSRSIKGTASADVTNVTWTVVGGANGDCSGTSSWDTGEIALVEGANIVRVTAVDGAGNSITKSITLHRISIQPPDSWVNTMMVSIPLIPDETDPKSAVGFDGNAWCIFRPTQNSYVVYADDPGYLTWLDPAAATPGRGFWARFVSTATTPLGEIPDQTQPATIHLYPGWNIIGNPFISPVTWDVTRITVREVGGTQKTLANSRSTMDDYAFGWRRTDGVGAYYVVYDANLIPGVDNILEPWMAYWVRVYRECDITFPAPPSNL